MKLRTTFLVALAALGVAPACATVKPWQRAKLADVCMTFEDDGVLGYKSHWQEAREGSAGGSGVQGGGCACK